MAASARLCSASVLRRRRFNIFFLLCVFLAFMKAGLYAANKRSDHVFALSFTNSPSPFDKNAVTSPDSDSRHITPSHPIPKLMENAESAFRSKIARQSKTLQAAVAEYRRRYGRPPPKGFDDWWHFARERNVIMVDEYDGLVKDLEPFWGLPGNVFRRRAFLAASLPSIDLVRVRDGKASIINLNKGFEDTEVSARAKGFSSMLSQFANKLPDLDFPVNTKAEGRVLIPWERRQYFNLTLQEDDVTDTFVPNWRGDGSVWEAWRRTCDPTTTARRLYSSQRNASVALPVDQLTLQTYGPGDDFVFASTTSFSIDFCKVPHAHYLQGHFFSDWRTLSVLYPILSPAKARGFLDIRIPSHYYYGSTQRYTYGWDSVNLELKEVDDMEVPWEKKEDKIFWRGATTGGGNNPPGFSPQYQRHRFLRLSSDQSATNRTVTFADPSGSSEYVSVPLSIRQLNEEIMDVAFVKATNPQSYPGGMDALVRDHRFGDSVPLGKHWSYKYLIDLDGMSYSGRFLSFLASDSVPIKSTVYEEYFTEWIQPWVHFIPLSASYKEIYNIYSFFSGPSRATLEAAKASNLVQTSGAERAHRDGDALLRRIARGGKQWKKTIGRTVDMEVYVYRLCLEYARLWADDRESMNFVIG